MPVGRYGTARSRSAEVAVAVTIGSVTLQSAANDQTTQKDEQNPHECALIIRDNFVAGHNHGDLVVAAAKSVGVSGPMVKKQIDTSRAVQALKTFAAHNLVLGRADATPKEVKGALDGLITEHFSWFVEGKTAEVENTKGFRHSVLNLSLGSDQVEIVKKVYLGLRQAWASKNRFLRAMAERKLVNVAKVLNLDATKLLSENPKVHGPERQKLQQALIARVAKIGESPTVKAAVSRWESAVDRFEADQNSVVISAGNSALEGAWLIADNGGHALTFPPNSQTSLLETEAVTSVGAISDFGGTELVASYSSRSPGVDVWLDGTLITRQGLFQGTSFAAPRGATIMTDIHCQNRGLDSDQVESRMVQELGRSRRPSSTGETVIDLNLARQRFW